MLDQTNVAVATTIVTGLTTQDKLASARAAAAKQKEAKGSGITATGAEITQGSVQMSQARKANLRQALLTTELTTNPISNKPGYAEMMRRFYKLQNAAGCLDICLYGDSGAKLYLDFVARNPIQNVDSVRERDAFKAKETAFGESLVQTKPITMFTALKSKLEAVKQLANNSELAEKIDQINQKIDTVHVEVFSPGTIENTNFTTSTSYQTIQPIDTAFERFSPLSKGHLDGYLHRIEVSANHSACANADPEGKFKELLASVIKGSWTVINEAKVLSKTATNTPDLQNAIKHSEELVLGILGISDHLLNKEYKTLTVK